MKRVLVIAYYFPPRPSIASLRLGGLAKYLPRFGWEPVIVTPRFPGRAGWSTPLVETGDRDILAELKRRLGFRGETGLQAQLGLSSMNGEGGSRVLSYLARLAKAVWCYPDDQRGWFPYAYEAALEAVRRFQCSAILSSSAPVTAHRVAAAVKGVTGLPWIADLRDLWTDNHYYSYPRIRRLVERHLERRTLGLADALVTVSEPLAQTLRRRYKTVPVRTILNGYDPDDVAPAAKLSGDFTITYTGMLYDGKRDPGPLFQALAELAAEHVVDPERIRVDFYGPDAAHVLPSARYYGVESLVAAHAPVPREEALQVQRRSQVLLLLNWNDPFERGVYTGKLFEYLAARRPILAVGGPKGVVSELLEETGAGAFAADRDAITAVLSKWWKEYLDSGRVGYEALNPAVERYSQVNMARSFACLLAALLGERCRYNGPGNPDPEKAGSKL